MGNLVATDPSAECAVLGIIPNFVSKQQDASPSWGCFLGILCKPEIRNEQILIYINPNLESGKECSDKTQTTIDLDCL